MANTSNKRRLFNGMNYRALQSSNTQRRQLLGKVDLNWLKQHHYRNVGWENVIRLHQQINIFLDSYKREDKDDLSLEELFLEADRIGNQYQTPEEISTFHEALSATVESIAQKVDQHFPDEEPEIIDFRPQSLRSRSSKALKSGKRHR